MVYLTFIVLHEALEGDAQGRGGALGMDSWGTGKGHLGHMEMGSWGTEDAPVTQ